MTSPPAPGPHEPSAGYSSFEREPEDRLAAEQIVAAGRYRVVRELGRGGMAIVYEAEDLHTGHAVALKVVVRRLADRDDATARYHNEARLAAALGRHPHVVHPYAVGRLPELHDRLYLVTELVRGRSLGAIVLEAPRGLAIERVCRIGRDVARALVALHERGIVHRDVKPGNVMLELHEGQERARLLDFGCAYATGDGGVAASADLTQAHERVGSPVYMAPEQALGLRPTPGFDIYAIGATLYELLTGAPPYAGSSKAEIVQRKCAPHDPPVPVARVRDGVPPRLTALVDGCLAREASNRPASAAVVLRELEVVMIELGLGAEVEVSRTSSTAAWRWLGAAMVLLLAGVVGVASFGYGGDGADEGPGVAASSPEPDDGARAVVEGSTASGPTNDEPLVTSGQAARLAAASGTTNGEPANANASPSGDPIDGTGAAKPGPRPKPAPPRWSTPECEAIRARAVDDRVARHWQALLEAVTRDRKCWRDDDERLLLRLTALNGLGRHEECVRLGGSSSKRLIQRITAQCRDELP
jgi:serine/threonine protein kinase